MGHGVGSREVRLLVVFAALVMFSLASALASLGVAAGASAHTAASSASHAHSAISHWHHAVIARAEARDGAIDRTPPRTAPGDPYDQAPTERRRAHERGEAAVDGFAAKAAASVVGSPPGGLIRPAPVHLTVATVVLIT